MMPVTCRGGGGGGGGVRIASQAFAVIVIQVMARHMLLVRRTINATESATEQATLRAVSKVSVSQAHSGAASSYASAGPCVAVAGIFVGSCDTSPLHVTMSVTNCHDSMRGRLCCCYVWSGL